MWWPFKRKKLNDLLRETKKVKIRGVIFVIKKINPMDHLTGAEVMMQTYADYIEKRQHDKAVQPNYEKMKKHLTDVLLAGVVKPELDRKPGGESIHVEEVFRDWDLAMDLYNEIMTYTYGKKKIK